MQNSPHIAVLVATYNGADFLEQQLDSLLSQTYTNFTIYISDDNSTDTTHAILKRYKLQYPDKIFYSINKRNFGFVKNFEKLLQENQSQYYAFCDQDDIWHKDKLLLELEAILQLELQYTDKACLVHTDLSMIDEDGKIIKESYFKYRKYTLKNTKDLGHILGPCGVVGNTLLINQSLKDLVLPFPENLDMHDYWIAVNCELFGVRKTIFKPLVKYRIHTHNSSNSKKKLKSSFFHFSRDMQLPNLETNRKIFLPLLQKKLLKEEDKEVLEKYLEYLNFANSKIIIYFNLLKYSLVKRDLVFRVKLLFKWFVTKRYR